MEAVLRRDSAHDGRDLVGADRIRALRNVVRSLAPVAAGDIDDVSRLFGVEFEAYGELIAALDSSVAGLLLRGEGEAFTHRVSALMDSWGMTDEAKAFHRTLAAAFDHKRAFLKLEWGDAGVAPQRQIAVYYRRRPYVHDALKILAGFAGTGLPLGEFRELGALLGKETIHFVAFTARPERALWHKFYFSQYLTPDSYANVEARLRRCVERFAPASPAATRWAAYHDRLAPRYRNQTVFTSLAVSEDGGDGSIKFDYPDVSPTLAAGLLDGAHSRAAEDRFRWLCDAAERRSLSYLGVRVGAADSLILKGYADFL